MTSVDQLPYNNFNIQYTTKINNVQVRIGKNMNRKRVLVTLTVIAAAVMIALGLFQVYQVYRHYRADILANESRHLESIIGTSATSFDWMLSSYDERLGMLVDRMEFLSAESEYAQTRDPKVMARLMSRRDIVRVDLHYCVAVWEGDTLLGATDTDFPARLGSDEVIGALGVLREDDAGRFWFVFSRDSDIGVRYELAVQVQRIFSDQAESARVGRNGYFFLLDREGRFISYSNGQRKGTASLAALIASGDPVSRLAEEEQAWDEGEEYFVFRYPWEDGSSETLAVTSQLTGTDGALVVGAAMSFSEFDSFLSDTLYRVTWIILLEVFGAMILCILAAWMMVQNRRSALELSAVRERADLMEEVNRQQQSLYHTERLQQLGVMTSGIVHEFNNMLTPVMGQSLLLLEMLADRDDTPEFEYALDVYESSEKARDMLRRMSAMGKKDVDIDQKTLDLGAVLRKTMNLSAMAKDPHITQELIMPEEPVFVTGNEQLLTQAFLNLCINACQAMGGEGTLTVSMALRPVSGKPYAAVTVSDTGPGIPEESLNSIYEPFFTTKGERGTGLGLAICKKIVESHKGTLQAANRAEGGAIFTVQIPVTELPEE